MTSTLVRAPARALTSLLLLAGGSACGDDAAGSTDAAATGATSTSSSSVGNGPGAGGGEGDGGDAGAGAGSSATSSGSGAGGGGGAPPIDPSFPEAHPRIYLNATQLERLRAALDGDTPASQRFRAFVDQALAGGDPYDFHGWHAALLYALTGDAAYGELAVARVDAFVAEEEATIAGGGVPSVAGDSYLEVGDRVGDAMLVLDWCFDLVTTEQAERWTTWANQAVWNVWHHEEATWGGNPAPWSGWSVDDPVNNYYFSFLRATMLLGLATYHEHPEGPAWVEHFLTTKIEGQLVPTYLEQLAGGGSREGTGYGVSMMSLFSLYDLWEQSTGNRIAGLTPHARESIAYMQHAIVPTRDRLAPIGDHARDSTAALFDYHRHYLLVAGALYPEDDATLASRSMLAASSVPEMSSGFMTWSDFLYDPSGLPTAPQSSLYPAYHGTGTGHVFARSSWDDDAVWLGFISGPYAQSHAHHDQGSMLVYHRGHLAYDANVDSHSGIRQEEEMHNLVRIEVGGEVVRQREGATPSSTLALEDEPTWAFFATDTASIYGEDSGVTSSIRQILWLKPGVFVVRDTVTTSASSDAVYQLNLPAQPTVTGARVALSTGDSSLDLVVLEPSSAEIDLLSWTELDRDSNAGYRVDVASSGGTTHQLLTVLSVDLAAVEVNRTGEGEVAIDLGGSLATVTFTGEVGGTFVIEDESTSFGPGVETWPLLAP